MAPNKAAAAAPSADFLEAADQREVVYAALGTGLKAFVYRKPGDSLNTLAASWWKLFKPTQTSLDNLEKGLQARLRQAVSNPALVQAIEAAVPESKAVINLARQVSQK